MRVHAQEALAEDDEASNMENDVWCEVMQLHTVRKQQASDEFVLGGGQPACQEIHKHNTLAGVRNGDYLISGASHLPARRRRKAAVGP